MKKKKKKSGSFSRSNETPGNLEMRKAYPESNVTNEVVTRMNFVCSLSAEKLGSPSAAIAESTRRRRLCGIRNTIYLFVIRACTGGAPKSNNDLNTRVPDTVSRYFGSHAARYRARNFINTLKILRHRRASRRSRLPLIAPRASSAPAAK